MRGCNMLQCVRSTPYCSILQCIAVYCSVLQCIADSRHSGGVSLSYWVCCSVLQRVVASQQAETQNTPFHTGSALNTRLCTPCLLNYAVSLLFLCVVDSFFFVLQCVAVCCGVLQWVGACCSDVLGSSSFICNVTNSFICDMTHS